jgi:hypothetical protein
VSDNILSNTTTNQTAGLGDAFGSGSGALSGVSSLPRVIAWKGTGAAFAAPVECSDWF